MLFILVSLPSIKMLVLGSAILNILPLALSFFIVALDGFGVRRFILSIHVVTIAAWLLFFLILSVSFFLAPQHLDNIEDPLKFFSILVYCVIFIFFLDGRAIDFGVILMVVWGGVVAVKKIFFGITFTESSHYLTVGLPIGVGVVAAASYVFHSSNKIVKVISIGYIVVCYFGLFSLFGRSPILFSAVVIFLFVVQQAFLGRNVRRGRRLLFFTLIFVGSALVGYVWLYLLPDGLAARMSRGLEEEPRVEAVYLPAIRAIMHNPFGYGIGSSDEVIGFYPHNIFLEVFLLGGVFLIVAFVFVSFKYFSGIISVANSYKASPHNYLAFAFVSLFLFLFWNVSADLLSAYALIPMMAYLSVWRMDPKFSFYDRSKSI